MDPRPAAVLDPDGLGELIRLLRERGYTPIGPTLQEGAIVYDEIASDAELPVGWTDAQEAGRYRVERRDDAARFGYNLGPRSWKRWLFPPRLRLWSARRSEDGFEVEADAAAPPAYAFLGVRACEIQALDVQDRVFLGERYTDPHYGAAREAALVIAVQCGQAASTCFCTSMGTGPRAESGFDLSLTELLEDGDHEILCEVGSERGGELLEALGGRPAGPEHRERAKRATERAASQISRRLDTDGIRDLLAGTLEHPRWDEVAKRCLSCANCTLVCPTCFCSDVQDVTDLTGDHSERWRVWDSCFNAGHSYIHGGSVRGGTPSRYRQWLTHKLGTWIDQFGTSGCVGCGRCIAWCPVGIDITEETAALREPAASADAAGTRAGPGEGSSHGDA